MRTALCTLDNMIYNAADFRQTANYSINRSSLVCTDCGVTAHHRRQGRDGREACFFAEHAEGCNLATMIHASSQADNDQDIFTTGQTIIVDFNFGTPEALAGAQPTAGGAAINGQGVQDGDNGPDSRDIIHRRLSSLLRGLIASDGYRTSTQTINVVGQGEYPISDFFINFPDATADIIGSYHGFWGEIPHTNVRRDSVWLNTGEPGATMSVLIPERFMEAIFQRYGIQSHREIIGSHMLVFGELKAARNGKLFIEVGDISQFALRLAR